MSNITTVITSPYIIIPNAYDYYYCNTGSNIIALPPNYSQHENINIINNSSANISINTSDNVLFKTLSPQEAVVIVSDLSTFTYKIVAETSISQSLDDFLKRDGTNSMTASLNFGNNKGINVLDPTIPSDVANKNYVDVSIGTGGIGFLKIDGTNSMTGNLGINNNKMIIGGSGKIEMGNIGTDSSVICIKQPSQLNNSEATSHAGIKVINPGSSHAFYQGYASGGTYAYFQQDDVGNYTRIFDLGTLGFPCVCWTGIDANSNQITRVLDPTAAQDAATKNYVDTVVPSIAGLLKTDGTNAMTANLNVGINKLVNVVDPTVNTDGATKNYVDNTFGPTTWKVAGNSGVVNGKLGTFDNNNFTLIQGDATIANIIPGELNIPGGNKLSMGTQFNTIDPALFNIKQSLSNSATETKAAIKITRNTIDKSNISLGLDSSANLLINAQNNAGNVTQVASMGSSLVTIYPQLSLNNTKILNVADPTTAQDAATKSYVDSSISGLSDFLRIDGGNSMQADINMDNFKIVKLADPTDAQEGVNLQTLNSLTLRVDGGNTMLADLNMGNFKIINVTDPTTAQDAVNLQTLNASLTSRLAIDGTNSMTGDLNTNANKITIGGTANTQNLAALNIKQQDVVGATSAASVNGIKMYKNGADNSNFYMGVDINVDFGIYFQAFNNASCTQLLSLDRFGGGLDLFSSKITSVADPTTAQDAATKAYVDNIVLTGSGLSPLIDVINSSINNRTGTIPTAGTFLPTWDPYVPFSGGIAGNGWQPTTTSNDFLMVQLQRSVIVKSFTLRSIGGANSISSYNIQGSNNGSTFTTLYTSAAGLTPGTFETFSITNSTPYKYIRFNMVTSTGIGAGLIYLQYYGFS